MNGATMVAARLVLTGGVYNDRALRAMAERHDRHCLQDADRLLPGGGYRQLQRLRVQRAA
jgi:hypothetical protein